MINSVNNVSFRAVLFPSVVRNYSTHTPKMQLYKEFYFMPELQKKNPVKSLFKNIVNNIMGIL